MSPKSLCGWLGELGELAYDLFAQGPHLAQEHGGTVFWQYAAKIGDGISGFAIIVIAKP